MYLKECKGEAYTVTVKYMSSSYASRTIWETINRSV